MSPSLGGISSQHVKQNAAAYVDGLLHPFETGPMRLPEPTGFPSTVGMNKWRQSVGVVQPSGGSQPGGLWGVVIQPYVQYPFFQLTASTGPAIDTWTSFPLPNLSTIQSNFYFTRCTALGIRVVDTAPMISRAGSLYISRFLSLKSSVPNDARLVAKNSADTIVLDLARLPADGIETIWLPLTLQPVTVSTNSATLPFSITGSAYTTPLYTGTNISDSAVIMFAELPSLSNSNPIFTIIYKYEAVPYPQNQYLFDLKTIAGSDDAAAKAFEEVQIATSTTSGATLESGGAGSVKAGPLSDFLSSGLKMASNAATGQFGKLGRDLLPMLGKGLGQIAKQTLGAALPMALSMEDWKTHQLACTLDLPQMSPLVDKEVTRSQVVKEYLRKEHEDHKREPHR